MKPQSTGGHGLAIKIAEKMIDMKKSQQKETITNVIAPEFDKKYLDVKNKLKNRERELIKQIQQHSDDFINKMEDSTKGDWVDSAKIELKNIEGKLDDIL